MQLDILAIGVHPDDVELCASGTLMMEKLRGKKVGVVDLTRGELGTRGTAELRLKEAARAAAILDLDVRENLGMADGFFKIDEEHQRKVIRALRKYRPEIVLTNPLEDRHPDHGRAGKLVAESCFLSGLRKVETLDDEGKPQAHWRPKYVFHFVQDRYYTPSFVYDISPVMERKIEAIKAYSSQFFSTEYKEDEPQTYISTPEFLNAIIGRLQMYGKMIGVPYAEGFISEKMLGVASMDAFVRRDT
ncbi:bacillithiol biosynthesis deacetylase BshB1 [Dinghuibacter silviterrae]|uniref:Bacillithiol biosynthesis deacetylase BshB1 n=1 Tax=Dinghuibacter silviterrae TaxID=1539049 RepID=A0A4R8DTB3_9BACT|nr:bacillithiol biosynthesis deacetylase BshB1 [Dinghuibacter silviterrae]TDX01136.1 bacillithiol biosynthesis deacetylase BshB1 [Dinghuibacter silviterrae]